MERIRTADVLAEAPSFRDLLLPATIVKSLESAGYLRPSPVQHAAIPLTRLGLDVIIQAKAGTGKTLVFAVTMTELINRSATFPQALVLAPTREVALQAADVITEVASGTPSPPLSVATLIGGLPTAEDERILRRKCHVIVGTPGRVLSLIQRGSLVTQGISMLVLDEADKLLGSDFSQDVNQVIATIPQSRQILALSATYTPSIAEQLKGLMHQPHEVMLCSTTTSLLGIAHYYKNVDGVTAAGDVENNGTGPVGAASVIRKDSIQRVDKYAIKRKALLRLLASISFQQAVVFCNNKATGDTLAENLISNGHAAACLSSDKDQLQRIEVLNSLRSFGLRIVVATDVAARGIDLDRVNLVVNFDLPAAHATLMHRVGRAGRFGTHGTAISLVYGNVEKDDLKRAVASAAGGDVFPLPEHLPVGWSAAQLLGVAAEKGKHYYEQDKVKVISTASVVPSSQDQTNVQNRTSNTDDEGTVLEIISSVSLWPEEQSLRTFQKPVDSSTWYIQLDELEAAKEEHNNISKSKSKSQMAPLVSLPAATERSSTHYRDIVRSVELDLQRTVDEALSLLEHAFALDSKSAAAAVEPVDLSLEDQNTKIPQPIEFMVDIHGEVVQRHHQLKQRRPLGSAQVTAYTRQVALEERDHHRALIEEAALLESIALGEHFSSYNDTSTQYSEHEEEEEEFDEHGYYKNPKGQQEHLHHLHHHRHRHDIAAESEEKSQQSVGDNEAVWRQYWYDYYNYYGYWPGGNPEGNASAKSMQIPPPPAARNP
jgi:superfamily II DNA/RNA helicase